MIFLLFKWIRFVEQMWRTDSMIWAHNVHVCLLNVLSLNCVILSISFFYNQFIVNDHFFVMFPLLFATMFVICSEIQWNWHKSHGTRAENKMQQFYSVCTSLHPSYFTVSIYLNLAYRTSSAWCMMYELALC